MVGTRSKLGLFKRVFVKVSYVIGYLVASMIVYGVTMQLTPKQAVPIHPVSQFMLFIFPIFILPPVITLVVSFIKKSYSKSLLWILFVFFSFSSLYGAFNQHEQENQDITYFSASLTKAV